MRGGRASSSEPGTGHRRRQAEAQGSILGKSPGDVNVQERLSQQKMRPNAQAVKIKLVAQKMVRETEDRMWDMCGGAEHGRGRSTALGLPLTS